MSGMFERCLSLTLINLSNFNTKNARYIQYMFEKIPKNCKIISKDKRILDEVSKCLIF